MVTGKGFIVAMREQPEAPGRVQSREKKSHRLNKANRLGRRGERDRGSERGDKDRRRPRERGPREHITKIVGL